MDFKNKADRELEHSATFKKLDTDGSGKLSLSEAKAGIESWAKDNKVKMTKDDLQIMDGIFFDNAGKEGELDLK